MKRSIKFPKVTIACIVLLILLFLSLFCYAGYFSLCSASCLHIAPYMTALNMVLIFRCLIFANIFYRYRSCDYNESKFLRSRTIKRLQFVLHILTIMSLVCWCVSHSLVLSEVWKQETTACPMHFIAISSFQMVTCMLYVLFYVMAIICLRVQNTE